MPFYILHDLQTAWTMEQAEDCNIKIKNSGITCIINFIKIKFLLKIMMNNTEHALGYNHFNNGSVH